jgi:hypothetical protein
VRELGFTAAVAVLAVCAPFPAGQVFPDIFLQSSFSQRLKVGEILFSAGSPLVLGVLLDAEVMDIDNVLNPALVEQREQFSEVGVNFHRSVCAEFPRHRLVPTDRARVRLHALAGPVLEFMLDKENKSVPFYLLHKV